MSYNVKFSEVQDLQNDYLQYKFDVADATEALSGKVDALVNLASFQGSGAESVKTYFSETHGTLIELLNMLVEQLATEYATEYYDSFVSDPISEDADNSAQWPWSTMKWTEDALDGIKTGDLADAAANLASAQNCLPGGVSFTFPSNQGACDAIDDEVTAIKRVRDAVGDAEDEGAAAFKDAGSGFNELANALSAAIAKCASGAISPTNYTSGTFSTTVDAVSITQAYDTCKTYQATNFELARACQRDSVEGETVRVQEAADEAAKKKKFWATVGTIASAVVVVGAAVATVASFGSAAPALAVALNVVAGTIGTVSAANDLLDRQDQLRAMKSDPGADKEASNDAVGFGISAGKTALKSKSKTIEGNAAYAEGDKIFWNGVEQHDDKLATEGWIKTEKGKKAIKEGKKEIGSFVADEVSDYVIDQVSDDGVKTGLKTGKEALTGAYDAVTAYKDAGGMTLKNGAGIVSTVGKCGTIVADHYMNKADAVIEDCSNRKEALSNLGDRLK